MNRPSIVAVHRDGGSVMADVVTSTLARLYLCSVRKHPVSCKALYS